MEYKLENIAEYVNEKIKISEIENGSYISTENMLPNKNGIVRSNKELNLNKVNYFKKGDILISNIRPYFKKIWYATFDGGCSNDVLIIRVKDQNMILSRYLYYLLSEDNFFKYIMFGSKGTKMPRGDKKQILRYIIKVPTLKEQNKIVNIIDVICKKIELNNQINNNLHEIIKQYIENKYNSNPEIKKGKVSLLGKIQGGYAFKSKDLINNITNNKILKIKNITSRGIDIENTQFICDEIADKVDKKFLLNSGEVIIALTGAELGKTGYVYGRKNRYFLNQRVGVVRGKDKFSDLYLRCVFLLDDMQSLLNSKGYGSAQPNISSSDIEDVEISIPDETELMIFYNIAEPIFNRMVYNSEENKLLEQLRGTLLPKLMNGEIDIDKIEI